MSAEIPSLYSLENLSVGDLPTIIGCKLDKRRFNQPYPVYITIGISESGKYLLLVRNKDSVKAFGSIDPQTGHVTYEGATYVFGVIDVYWDKSLDKNSAQFHRKEFSLIPLGNIENAEHNPPIFLAFVPKETDDLSLI